MAGQTETPSWTRERERERKREGERKGGGRRERGGVFSKPAAVSMELQVCFQKESSGIKYHWKAM